MECSAIWQQEQKKIAQAAKASSDSVAQAGKKSGGAMDALKGGLGKIGQILSGSFTAIGGGIVAAIGIDAVKAWHEADKLHASMAAIIAMPATGASSIESLNAALAQTDEALAKIRDRQNDVGATMKTKVVDSAINAWRFVSHSKDGTKDSGAELEGDETDLQEKRNKYIKLQAAKRRQIAAENYETGAQYNGQGERERVEREFKESMRAASESAGGGDDLKQAAADDRARKLRDIERKEAEMKASGQLAYDRSYGQKEAFSGSAKKAELEEVERKRAEAQRQIAAKGGTGAKEEAFAAEQTARNEIAAIEKKYRLEEQELAMQKQIAEFSGPLADRSINALHKQVELIQEKLTHTESLNAEEKKSLETQLAQAHLAEKDEKRNRLNQAKAAEQARMASEEGVTSFSGSARRSEIEAANRTAQEKIRLAKQQGGPGEKDTIAAANNQRKLEIAQIQKKYDLESMTIKAEQEEATFRGTLSQMAVHGLEVEIAMYNQRLAGANLTKEEREDINSKKASTQQRLFEAGVANYFKSPQERLNERQQDRTRKRHNRQYEAAGASVAYDMAHGVQIDPNSRRGAIAKSLRDGTFGEDIQGGGDGQMTAFKSALDESSVLQSICDNVGINK